MKKHSFYVPKLFRLSLFLIAAFGLLQIPAQAADSKTKNKRQDSRKQTALWKQVAEDTLSLRGQRVLLPERYKVFRLNQSELTRVFANAPLEFSDAAQRTQTILTVPNPNGKMVRFRLEESPILAPEIAAKYPNWKTYQGYGIDEPGTSARFDWTDTGFHGYIMTPEGTFSIDPYQTNDRENYLVFYKKEFGAPQRAFHCKLDELLSEEKGFIDFADKYHEAPEFVPSFTHGSQIRNYRLAIATTFEYTNVFRQTGDTNEQAQTRAFNQVVTSVNRIDAVYRKELAVSFTLVSGTNLVYAVNPETPANYANNGSSSDLNINQTNVDAIIGTANYDVAHLFETVDSGIAQLSSVCGASKARGLSGQPNPVGDPFDVDYVAHELGHQFAANHTFNATANCNNSPAAARMEPGSAVTIMGYAGICSSSSNVQRNSIDIFHVYNLTEAINFITNGAGATCGTVSGNNSAPVITPLSNYTIPFNTPFVLTANAVDADNDPITYNWEQFNAGASPSSYPNTTDDDDVSLVARPGFRSYLPTTGPSRTFPSLTYILNNSNEAPVTFTGTSPVGSICAGTCISGEDLPSAARTMNFRVSVRDGRGGISDAGTQLNVVNTGTPFRVSSNNLPTVWNFGASRTITWDVSGTNGGSINTANVKISLSTDGGQTFGMVLAENTPNDGSHDITVPAIDTTAARIKVEAVGNIFFDISDVNFTIVSTPATSGFISGRVSGANGLGVSGVRIVLTGGNLSQPLVAVTNSFGYYRFTNVSFGQIYTLTPQNKKYTFAPVNIVRTHTNDVSDLNFTVGAL